MTHFILVSTISLTFMVQSAWPQALAHQVSGFVKDTSGLTIPGCTILLKKDGAAAPLSTVSDAHGSFLFESVPLGEYELRVTLEGFAPHVASLSVVRDVEGIEAVLEIEHHTDQITVQAQSQGGVTIDPAESRHRQHFGRCLDAAKSTT